MLRVAFVGLVLLATLTALAAEPQLSDPSCRQRTVAGTATAGASADTRAGVASDVRPDPKKNPNPPTSIPVLKTGDQVSINVNCGEVSSAAAAAAATAAPPAPATSAPKSEASPPALKPSDVSIGTEQIFRLGVLAALALVAILLALFAIRLARQASDRTRDDDRGIRYTSHWGGFGGADSGWTLSSTAVELILAAVLAIAAVVIALSVVQALNPKPPTEASAKTAASK